MRPPERARLGTGRDPELFAHVLQANPIVSLAAVPLRISVLTWAHRRQPNAEAFGNRFRSSSMGTPHTHSHPRTIGIRAYRARPAFQRSRRVPTRMPFRIETSWRWRSEMKSMRSRNTYQLARNVKASGTEGALSLCSRSYVAIDILVLTISLKICGLHHSPTHHQLEGCRRSLIFEGTEARGTSTSLHRDFPGFAYSCSR